MMRKLSQTRHAKVLPSRLRYVRYRIIPNRVTIPLEGKISYNTPRWAYSECNYDLRSMIDVSGQSMARHLAGSADCVHDTTWCVTWGQQWIYGMTKSASSVSELKLLMEDISWLRSFPLEEALTRWAASIDMSPAFPSRRRWSIAAFSRQHRN